MEDKKKKAYEISLGREFRRVLVRFGMIVAVHHRGVEEVGLIAGEKGKGCLVVHRVVENSQKICLKNQIIF